MNKNQVKPLVEIVIEIFQIGFEDQEKIQD